MGEGAGGQGGGGAGRKGHYIKDLQLALGDDDDHLHTRFRRITKGRAKHETIYFLGCR